jgi:hypothetical protein
MTDEIDSFAAMFSGPPSSRRRDREARLKRERRTQLTDKQRARARTAERTAQINFRCSPAFKDKAHAVKDFLGAGYSIADVLEEALDMFAEAKGFKGTKSG